VWQAYEDQGVRVWGITSREDEQVVRTFVEQYGVTFPVLLDSNGDVNRDYRQDPAFPSAAYPQDWVIGTDGKVAYVNNGFELDAMETALDNELAGAR
jgi:peroxiredoxin